MTSVRGALRGLPVVLAGLATQGCLYRSLEPEEVVLDAPEVVLPSTWHCSGRITVRAFVEGRGPFVLALDTGSRGVVLSPESARGCTRSRNWGLGITSESERDASGEHIPHSDPVRCRSVRIGGLELRGQGCLVQSFDAISGEGDDHLDGVLGTAAFSTGLLIVDGPKREVRFALGELPPPDGKRVLPLEGTGEPLVELRLGDDAIPVYLDTGFSSYLLICAVPDGVPLLYGPTPWGTARAWTGAVRFELVRLQGDLLLGAVRMKDPAVATGGVVSVLGMDFLRKYRVTFDFGHGRVRIEGGPQVHSVAAWGSPSGLDLDLLRIPARIVGVAAGSAAERAGLRVGDEVIHVDGIFAEFEREKVIGKALGKTEGTIRFHLWRDGGEAFVEVEAGGVPGDGR